MNNSNTDKPVAKELALALIEKKLRDSIGASSVRIASFKRKDIDVFLEVVREMKANDPDITFLNRTESLSWKLLEVRKFEFSDDDKEIQCAIIQFLL